MSTWLRMRRSFFLASRNALQPSRLLESYTGVPSSSSGRSFSLFTLLAAPASDTVLLLPIFTETAGFLYLASISSVVSVMYSALVNLKMWKLHSQNIQITVYRKKSRIFGSLHAKTKVNSPLLVCHGASVHEYVNHEIQTVRIVCKAFGMVVFSIISCINVLNACWNIFSADVDYSCWHHCRAYK